MTYEKTIETLQKKYGEEVIHKASETPDFEVVSTGSYTLDFATGIGGFPRGFLIEIFGRESSGKTSLAYYMLAEEQRRLRETGEDKQFGVAFINLEGRFALEWAEALGVDSNRLHVANPKDGSDAADILYDLVNSGAITLIVFDSVGAMLGKEEMEGTDRVGGQAKLVTGMVKRVIARAFQNRCTVVFLNQARDNMIAQYPGAIESPGGHGLKHSTHLRIQIKRMKGYLGTVDGKKKEIGFRVSTTVLKNKAGGSPKRVAEFDFFTDAVDDHTLGIDHTEEIMSLSMREGIDVIERAGAYYRHPLFPDGQIRSREVVAEFLQQSPEVVQALRKELIAKVRGDTNGQVSS